MGWRGSTGGGDGSLVRRGPRSLPAVGAGRSTSTCRSGPLHGSWVAGCCSTPSPTKREPVPTTLGVVFVSTALAALVLAISKDRAGAGRVDGWWRASAAAVVLGAAFVYRSAHHAAPVLDLTLFSARSFSVANAATLLYSMGFFAMLLGNILFLTSVWHYSILRAGLAVTPGPLVVAVVSGPAGRLAGGSGSAGSCSSARPASPVGSCGTQRGSVSTLDYLARWLPATLITGLGIGLTFPVLERGGGVEPPSRAFCGRQCREPDGATGGRCSRRGLARRNPRDSQRRRPSRRLPASLVVRRCHGGVVWSVVRSSAPCRCSSANRLGCGRSGPRQGPEHFAPVAGFDRSSSLRYVNVLDGCGQVKDPLTRSVQDHADEENARAEEHTDRDLREPLHP